VELLRDRPQLVFYGPPGTGKTYVAQALAEHLVGGKPENVQLVQFHPAYSYEDFFEGYRPRPSAEGVGVSFELTRGPLRRLADAARSHPGEPHVLIIDEINRGNLARIFGELYFLLEYRGKAVNLLYGSDEGRGFTLPRNLIVLGTMNTADRSIALVDAAMRRRFSFVELHPSAEPVASLLRRWLVRRELPDDAARLLDELNARIDDRDFRIGPSYLMRPAAHADPRGLDRVWRTQILPLLEEHHYGDGTDVPKTYDLDVLRAHVGMDEGSGGAAVP
jgi:5-methylcytosine-specific restriction protein B